MNDAIETRRLRLLNARASILDAALRSDEELAALLRVTVPKGWTQFGEPAFRLSLEKIFSHPEEAMWWTYLPVLKEENMLIGSGGYMGKPDEQGCVEIGYEIMEHFRNRGLATEMAAGLIENAFRFPEVSTVCAHTMAEENASVKVLKKCGMVWIRELIHPEDGKIWKWQIRKPVVPD